MITYLVYVVLYCLDVGTEEDSDSYKGQRRKMYIVEKIIEHECEKDDCNLKCNECHTCFHTCRCSCIENSIKMNMCKHIHHIHLLCLTNFRDYNESLHHIHEIGNKVPDRHVPQICDEDGITTEKLDNLRQEVHGDFENLMKKAVTGHQLELVKKCLKNTLVAITVPEFPLIRSQSSSSTLRKQERF